MEKKKQLILLVLKILETESDANHPLTQTEIAKTISDVYPCDRKTVGRNIKYLCEMGYPIIKTGKGFYMDRKAFSVDEIEFIISAVMNSKGKRIDEKKELTDKIRTFFAGRYSNK